MLRDPGFPELSLLQNCKDAVVLVVLTNASARTDVWFILAWVFFFFPKHLKIAIMSASIRPAFVKLWTF